MKQIHRKTMIINNKLIYAAAGAAVFSVLLTVGIFIYNRFMISDTERIKNSIENIKISVQQKAARIILWEVSEDYHDSFGQDKKQLSEKVRYWCSRNLGKEINLELTDLQITFDSDKENATAYVTVGGNQPIQQIIKHFSGKTNQRIRVAYRKKDRWQIVNCEKY